MKGKDGNSGCGGYFTTAKSRNSKITKVKAFPYLVSAFWFPMFHVGQAKLRRFQFVKPGVIWMYVRSWLSLTDNEVNHRLTEAEMEKCLSLTVKPVSY